MIYKIQKNYINKYILKNYIQNIINLFYLF